MYACMKALAELRAHQSGIAKHFSDKMCYIFLFARKLDVERTVVLLTNYSVCTHALICYVYVLVIESVCQCVYVS